MKKCPPVLGVNAAAARPTKAFAVLAFTVLAVPVFVILTAVDWLIF